MISVHFADEHIAVVDKPAGLFAVPARGAETDPSRADCVVSRVKAAFAHADGPISVHRLDMETSGLMVLGLSRDAHRTLSRQFERRCVSKSYEALLDGHVAIETHIGAIDLPLIADWPNRPKQTIDFAIGKPSRTLFRVIERTHTIANETHIPVTRVMFYPVTGRSHQLRMHAAAPIVVPRQNTDEPVTDGMKHDATYDTTIVRKPVRDPYVGTSLDAHAPRELHEGVTLPGGLSCPILGDSLYNTSEHSRATQRMMLHACELTFFHPVTDERVTMVSDAPF